MKKCPAFIDALPGVGDVACGEKRQEGIYNMRRRCPIKNQTTENCEIEGPLAPWFVRKWEHTRDATKRR